MRLSFLILWCVLPAAAAAAPTATRSPARCTIDRPVLAEGKQAARAKKLGELPPGQLYLSVDRNVGGCREPAIIRYNFSGGAPTGRGRR